MFITKKEKETLNITFWKLANRYLRAENKGADNSYLDGYFFAMTTVFHLLSTETDLNQFLYLIDLLVKIKKGMTYEEIFNK